MILKQRFADGRTAYTDIGNQWLYIQQPSNSFKELMAGYFKSGELGVDCIGFIEYGDRRVEPIFKTFPQWIYSNEGSLFMNLTYID